MSTASGGSSAPTSSNPDDIKKEKLENDAEFAKILKALKMGVPAHQIRLNMRQKGKYDPDDLLMFCDTATIMQLKKIGDYKGNKY